MKKLWCLCVAVMFAVAGCKSQSEGAGVEMQSRALSAAVIDVLEEAMAHRKAGGEPLPPGATEDPYFSRSVAESIEAQFPAAFTVTTVQEHAFQHGTFGEDHQATRREELTDLLRQAEERGIRFNTISFELLRQHAEEPLSGIKLELLVRLLRAQLS